MRVGRNPAKATKSTRVEISAPPPVSVGLLTHAPFLAGYHSQALDVVRLSVLSAKFNAGREVHLVVVDNGSCAQVQDWLLSALRSGTIDQLVLNRTNLGKVTAVSQILLGSPGPNVVYSDGDLRFLPGWLDPMLAVSEAFPEAGIVGGAPSMNAKIEPRRGTISLQEAGALAGCEIETGMFLRESYVRDWLSDTGLEGKELTSRSEEILAIEDIRLRRGDNTAMWGSPHCQYLLTSAARAEFRPQVGTQALNSQETHSFDDTLDSLGFLRLSVEEPVYRHVGNRLGDDDRRELARLDGGAGGVVASSPPPGVLTSPVWGLTPVRRLARRLHHLTFRVLYDSKPRPGWGSRRRS